MIVAEMEVMTIEACVNNSNELQNNYYQNNNQAFLNNDQDISNNTSIKTDSIKNQPHKLLLCKSIFVDDFKPRDYKLGKYDESCFFMIDNLQLIIFKNKYSYYRFRVKSKIPEMSNEDL